MQPADAIAKTNNAATRVLLKSISNLENNAAVLFATNRRNEAKQTKESRINLLGDSDASYQ